MTTKKPDTSVLGQNIRPIDMDELAGAMEASKVEAVVAAPRTVPHLRKIILDPHEDIPSRGGLYVGYNGRQFLLPTNRPVLVPQGVVNVLDDAILEVPVRDPDTLRFLGSRPAKRFQYRFTQDDPGAQVA